MTAVLSLMGPNARDAAGSASSPDDVSPRALQFSHTREIDVGFARVRAARMSYVGGPGFELYVPIEMARHVYLRAAARPARDLGLRGRRLLRDRRAAHRGRPPRLGRRARRPTRRRSRPGLGFAVKLDKPGGFIGRDALARAHGAAAAQEAA